MAGLNRWSSFNLRRLLQHSNIFLLTRHSEAYISTYSNSMPLIAMPKGALAMLILRVLQVGPLHGYAIAQRIRQLSGEVLEPEEGSLYPALQRILMEGWVTGEWGVSETKRRVRFYSLTKDGQKRLKQEIAEYEKISA